MADILHGPVRSMPGSYHRLPAGQMCDNHPDRPAVVRIQGETDSMGCELNDLCVECRGVFLNQILQFFTGQCDRCGNFSATLQKWRDPEEGPAGRLYDACEGCRKPQAPGEAESPEETARIAQMVEEFDPDIDPDSEDVVELPEDPDLYPGEDDA